MKNILIAAALACLSIPAIANEKLEVWVQENLELCEGMAEAQSYALIAKRDGIEDHDAQATIYGSLLKLGAANPDAQAKDAIRIAKLFNHPKYDHGDMFGFIYGICSDELSTVAGWGQGFDPLKFEAFKQRQWWKARFKALRRELDQ